MKSMLSNSILDAIGNTPMLEVECIYCKLEYLNPSGSIKKLDSELHVVYVEPVPDAYATPGWGGFEADLPAGVRQHVEEEARTKLEEELRHIQEVGGEVAEAHVGEGRPGAEIVRLAEELDIGLIVLGSRGLGGVKRALIGSVSDSVVRHAHCPVLVVRK